MNNQSLNPTGVPMAIGGLSNKAKISVQTTEADNGFILSWYSPKESTHRTYLCLSLEEVGKKFTELFSK